MKDAADSVTVHVGGSVLPRQDSVKYLGGVVDRELNWRKHTDKVRRMHVSS